MARRAREKGVPWGRRLAAGAAAACALYVLWLPDVAALKRHPPRTTAYIELREAQARARGRRLRVERVWVPYGRIARSLKDAVLMSEDGTFWRHGAVDWEAVRDAVRVDASQGRLAYGGSTITQQLARNLYLSPSKNPLRKLKEALIAWRLERALGKRRILELYLNVVEWGPGVFGCEAAARHYFGKSAADLSYEEAAELASILPSPRRWSPVHPNRRVRRRIDRLIARLRATGKMPQPEPVFLTPLETPAEAAEPEPDPAFALPSDSGSYRSPGSGT